MRHAFYLCRALFACPVEDTNMNRFLMLSRILQWVKTAQPRVRIPFGAEEEAHAFGVRHALYSYGIQGETQTQGWILISSQEV